MTPELEALARRAVACKGWRWMPGMRMLHPRMGPARVLRDTQQGVWVAKEESLASGFRVDEDGCLADLSDPATLGCVLALVKMAWKQPLLFLAPDGQRGWAAVVNGMPIKCHLESEAEALVAALEAAPCKKR